MTETQAHSFPSTASENTSDNQVLEFRDVALQFQQNGQSLSIIQGVSFSLRHSEFISIVGPSGCGKTSLLRMVAGLTPVEMGQLLFRSQPIQGSLNSVGIAFQNPVLLPWRNTLQNVLLPLEIVQPYKQTFRQKLPEHITAAQELLATVGLDGFQKYYPWQLSGGMRQRASLCRALIHQPELLLLDEPFGALDAFTREDMWVMLQRLWQRTGCTSILVTHDLQEAVFLSDTIYVMSPRPSQIVLRLRVNLPRPRTLEMCLTDEFYHFVAEVRKHIHRSY
ncbi:MAG: ABC transporter ATP-binding protein [Cyanobacteriota bacterium]|nr:ABC transporter ATP-binding protein [Cyanobacteriota bacterium]